MKDNFIMLKNFLEKKQEKENAIFIGKTKKSILIGPYTDKNFKYEDFYKRLTSSCLYDNKLYKNISEKKAIKFIEEKNIKFDELKNNMIEYYNDGNIIVHKFIHIP